MKKYRVTKEHGFLKEGILYFMGNDKLSYTEKDADFTYILDYNITFKSKWLNSGWVEEIQEPEFTKSDMILFGQQCAAEWQKHKLLYVDNELAKYVDSN